MPTTMTMISSLIQLRSTTVAENGSNAGSIGATLAKNFSGTSAGNFTTRFRAYGTPDTSSKMTKKLLLGK